MIEKFMSYVCNYNKNKDEVVCKIEHSLRVHEMILKFAEELGFNEELIELAGVIGLLHDIGCFDLIKMEDSSIKLDHADYGIKVLFDDNLIEDIYNKEAYYPVVKHAIKEHNKFNLELTDDELTMKMSQLIRDVDKIDIFYQLGVLGTYNKEDDQSQIKNEVLEAIKNKECINHELVETNNERLAATFALVFDINYDISLKFIRKYVEALYNRVGENGTFEEIYNNVIKYLDERIDEIC